MQHNKLLIIGSGGHAKVVIDAAKLLGYKIVGLIDDFLPIGEQKIGHRVLGTVSDVEAIMKNRVADCIFVAIGDNAVRSEILLKLSNTKTVTIIHPTAVVAKSAFILDGTYIGANCVINADSVIGIGCIINTSSVVEHDCRLMDFSSLAPSVVLGGDCTIGETSAIGIASVLKHGIKIGSNTVIGAGSVVLNDMGSNCLCFGTPCEKIKPRKFGDRYL